MFQFFWPLAVVQGCLRLADSSIRAGISGAEDHDGAQNAWGASKNRPHRKGAGPCKTLDGAPSAGDLPARPREFAPGKMLVDKAAPGRSLFASLRFSAMSTPETTPRSLTPPEIPFTTPQLLNRCVTDTGKILPRKYTGLCSKHQRAVTKTIKRSRGMLLAR